MIARAQLLGLGFGRGAIRHRTATGRLHVVHREVYAVGHRRLTVYGRWMAAVLACGPNAALSHRSAAALWGLAQASGARVDVTTPRRSGSSRPGIRLHRVRKMHPHDLAARDGIPVTSVARTLLDLAEIVDRRGLERMLEEAERTRLLDLRAVEQACARGHGRRGLKPLVAHLRTLRPAPQTRSELERRFLALCRELALPPRTSTPS